MAKDGPKITSGEQGSDKPESKMSAWQKLKFAASVGAMSLAGLGVLVAGIDELGKLLNTDAQKIPVKLPKPVKRHIKSAVRVEYNTGQASWYGSGAKVGQDIVLTAGHVVLDQNSGGSFDCEGSFTLNANTSPGHGDRILGWQATYAKRRDIAVLRVSRDEDFAALPTAPVAKKQPEKGAAVFFINFESGEKAGSHKAHSSRYPNTGLARAAAASSDLRVYGHPAEFAGTVLGHLGTDLIVATGVQSYGPNAGSELNIHHGGSGGPVFNSAGKIVGEVSQFGPTVDNVDIFGTYGVNAPSTPDERPTVLVQPVTRHLLHQMVHGLPEESLC